MEFLTGTSEDANFNQYWYSAHTIGQLIAELESQCSSVAFLSTPSVYFSLSEESPLKTNSKVLDFDTQWKNEPAYVFYDYKQPEELPSDLLHKFDGILIDPPFITSDVWQKYATTAKLLLKEGGKVICTTIAENEHMMKDLLNLQTAPFKPFIPNLVYQYNLYLNFEPRFLHQANHEVIE